MPLGYRWVSSASLSYLWLSMSNLRRSFWALTGSFQGPAGGSYVPNSLVKDGFDVSSITLPLSLQLLAIVVIANIWSELGCSYRVGPSEGNLVLVVCYFQECKV